MDTPEALAALRSLDALTLPRRQYLASLVATALTNQDRARIVVMAKRENTDQRFATKQALNAELAERARWASRERGRTAEGPQKPSQRTVRTDDTTPEHRPVTVRFVEPTQTAKGPRARPEGIGTDRRYDKPEHVPTERPSGRTHGIVSTYNFGCRCGTCITAARCDVQGRCFGDTAVKS